MLAAFGETDASAPAKAQPLIELLSDREIQILHHLAASLSNQAIANQTFISLATVKWHARNIYSNQ